MIRKVARFKKNRRQISMETPARPFYTVPTFSVPSGSTVVVNFDQAVSVSAAPPSTELPGWVDTTTTPHRTVTAVAVNSSTQITLTFSGALTAADVINIPNQDPSIRTTQGGFVLPGDYVLP